MHYSFDIANHYYVSRTMHAQTRSHYSCYNTEIARYMHATLSTVIRQKKESIHNMATVTSKVLDKLLTTELVNTEDGLLQYLG